MVIPNILKREALVINMTLWKFDATVEDLQRTSKGTMVEHIGIEFLELGEDYIKARMPVDHRTTQPFGLLHGGASVVLAETLGSVAAHLSVGTLKKQPVGIEINANHIRPATSGYVYGIVTPIHIGKSTHVWQIKISDEGGKLVCISRITIAILDST